MAALSLTPLLPGQEAAWDAFVGASANGALFHRLDFLAYHGERFGDAAHHLLWRKGDSLFAVMPLGLFREGGGLAARSPFGASFGGVVHGPRLRLKYALEMMDLLLDHLKSLRVRECIITTPPQCYHRQYTNVLEFALCRLGFSLRNREVTHAIPLLGVTDPFQPLDSSTRTQVRKAQNLGVSIERNAPIEVAYPLVVKTKERLGNLNMTHTEADLKRLQAIDPGFVKVDVAWHEGIPVAANVFLCSPACITSFYPSHLKEHAHTSALSLLTFDAIRWCIDTGRSHLDLGCSSVQMAVNASLSEFKESFGAVGYFRDTFGMAL